MVLVYDGAMSDDKTEVEVFVDSNYAGCMDTRKSLFGYVFTMFGTTINWKGSLHKFVVLSTTKVGYISFTKAVKETL